LIIVDREHQQPTLFVGGPGGGPAGGDRDEFQPTSREFQQIREYVGCDAIGPTVFGFEKKFSRRAVARDVDYIPARSIFQDLLEPLKGNSILHHLYLGGAIVGGDAPDELHELVALAAQVERAAALGEREQAEHPELLSDRCGRGVTRACLDYQHDTRRCGEFEREEGEILGAERENYLDNSIFVLSPG
jgi:hypothetical protein